MPRLPKKTSTRTGEQAIDKFEEWSEEVSERTDTGYKDQKVKSKKEREKRIKEIDEVIKEDLD